VVALSRCNRKSCGATGCGILFCKLHCAVFKEDQDEYDCCYQCKDKFEGCCVIF